MAFKKNIHPGEILKEEFLLPLGISVDDLSNQIDISSSRINAIIKGEGNITADIALIFSKYFGNSASFWIGLQDDFDTWEAIEKGISSGIHPNFDPTQHLARLKSGK
jgi:addiction module HigA family antidote